MQRIGLPVKRLAPYQHIAEGLHLSIRVDRVLPLPHAHIGPGQETVDIRRAADPFSVARDIILKALDRRFVLAMIVGQPPAIIIDRLVVTAARVTFQIALKRGERVGVALLIHLGAGDLVERFFAVRALLGELRKISFGLLGLVTQLIEREVAKIPLRLARILRTLEQIQEDTPGLGIRPMRVEVARARNLYAHWSYAEARRIFLNLLKSPKYAGESKWYLGHLALNKLRDKPKQAEAYFSQLAEQGPHREESLYQVARAQMNQERYADALATLERYLKRYPRGSHDESVYYYRGWLPYDHRQNEAAVEGFKNYIARYGKRVGRASYVYGFLAWTYMRMGQWQNAVDTYAEMKSFGNMLVWGKALYWQAYALHELEKDDEAIASLDTLRATYPVTYYGMLGEQLRARIRGEDERASKVWWPEEGALAAAPQHARALTDFKLRGLSQHTAAQWQKVQALVALDELARAREVFGPIRDALRQSVAPAERDAWVRAVGQYIEDFHPMWLRATGGSIAANPRPPKPATLGAEMAYPHAYESVVRAVSQEFELPPELMWAIMRQESRYRPAQISYTDAVGALQMIPKTARKVARDLGITYNPRTFPKPAVGFRYSGYYLRKLLDTFDGLIVPAAAAYNSGPKIVAHWFRQNPDVSFAWLIEEFAYNEGRNYGRKVAEHMLRYLYLYEPDPERRGQILDQLFPTSRAIQIRAEVGY